ncbi:acyltransferase family protein [Flavobacterium sp. Arc3]|uniref:acyltransferase family protein n=1 Tax=unclassified Flavobacterium TaxID=196869 RepID=UPI00352C21A9
MSRKNGIDLFRLIAAFFIMCIHTNYGSLNPEYVDTLRLLSRWAVPFYFLATGFFLGDKIVNNNLDFNRIQKNVSMLISILIVASIIYLPIDFIHGNNINSIATILTGSYFHLWFIGGLLIGYIFIWYLFYIQKIKVLPYISIFILLSALLTDSYDQLFNQNIDFSLFSLLLSIPFMHIGIIISKKDTNLISNKLLIALVLIGFSIQFIEAELFLKLFDYKKYTHQFLLGTIITAIPLFILSSKINLKKNRFSKWGKKYSLLLFLYHPLVYEIIRVVLTKVVPNYYDTISIFYPFIGFALTLTFAIMLNRLFPKIYNILNGNFNEKIS